jgi:hypothetical protein
MARFYPLFALLTLELTAACSARGPSSPQDSADNRLGRPMRVTCDPTGDPTCQPPPPPPPSQPAPPPPCADITVLGGATSATPASDTSIAVSIQGPQWVRFCQGPAKWTATVTGTTAPVYYYWYVRSCTGQYNLCGDEVPWTLVFEGQGLSEVLIPVDNTVRTRYTYVEVREDTPPNYRTGISHTETSKGPAWGVEGDSAGAVYWPCPPGQYALGWYDYTAQKWYMYSRNNCSGDRVWDPNNGQPPGF